MNISGIHVVASGIQRICRVNVDWSGELLLEGAGDGGRVAMMAVGRVRIWNGVGVYDTSAAGNFFYDQSRLDSASFFRTSSKRSKRSNRL